MLAASPGDSPQKSRVGLVLPKVEGRQKAHDKGTACGACHSTTSWTDVRFDHKRTGFELTGKHVRTGCKACHTTNFVAPLAHTCSACHRDVHAGELGARCEGCHETSDWRTRFDVDAHRRTNFPLLGAHAALPCVECHAEARERRFSRAVVDCQQCHQADAQRTQGLDKPVNHVTWGLEQRPCRECHSPLSFRPALFPIHDTCFPISSGAHAGVACLGCHSSLEGVGTLVVGTCRTNTARCTSCHTNDGAGASRISFTDQQHEGVGGYQFRDRRCYDCHYPTSTAMP